MEAALLKFQRRSGCSRDRSDGRFNQSFFAFSFLGHAATPVQVPEAVSVQRFSSTQCGLADWRPRLDLLVSSSPEWLASQRTWTAEITLVGGFLVTLSLTALVNVLSPGRCWWNGWWRKATEELSEANERLESEIQHRKMTEAALRQSESSLKSAQRISRIGSWESTHPDAPFAGRMKPTRYSG